MYMYMLAKYKADKMHTMVGKTEMALKKTKPLLLFPFPCKVSVNSWENIFS
jgi:hypothetical protein